MKKNIEKILASAGLIIALVLIVIVMGLNLAARAIAKYFAPKTGK